jgi:phage shock protein A
LKQQLMQLKGKLDEARTRQGTLIARKRAAEARKHIAQGMAGIGEDAFSSFDRFRQRIEAEEFEAEAHEEMAGTETDLEDEIGKLERKDTVDEQLKALKSRLGKSNA